ncbi:hypothetical protein OEIGOIKO_06992 [Streptomyces chrestomyceticus JCM 4735]|uniref:Uncharacterized protein n=1 Tax=Streptomyces chrestomyceticus JCM 4735 TaxID=1306181 RepID=A0A7U9L2H2_9ACTN|nr:hypothetical protein [Streptomyces chrestomyceticus]GCD39163.1 hypothetical protein OEIGOIKO_06992 [Streptomyces chrestomyceticus JCM 4735]
MPSFYAWTYTDDDGIRRQMKIRRTRDDRDVVWAPRFPGGPAPWFDADHAENAPSAYFGEADLTTLGVPVAAWPGFDD